MRLLIVIVALLFCLVLVLSAIAYIFLVGMRDKALKPPLIFRIGLAAILPISLIWQFIGNVLAAITFVFVFGFGSAVTACQPKHNP